MSLKTKLMVATKAAMKAKAKNRLTVLRGFSAAIKQREIDEQIELDEVALLAVLDKQIKQRKDSLKQFRDAGRDDLADKEAEEIDILSTFLPEPLQEDEVLAIIDKAMAEVGESSLSAMGKIVGLVRPQVQGRADMGLVSRLIKSRLS